MNNLNICFISEPLFPINATTSRTLNFAKSLVDRGHNVIILTLRESFEAPQEEFYNGCRIIRFEGGIYPVKFYRERRNMYLNFFLRGSALQFYAKIVDIVNTFNVDILHCANYFPSVVGAGFRPFIRDPTICDLHASIYLESYPRGMYVESIIGRAIEKILCKFSDALIVPVPEFKDYLCKSRSKNERKEKIYVVPSSIDVDLFKPCSDANLRNKLGLPSHRYLVFYHGSPYPENFRALKDLIQVVDELNRRGFPTKALVAGHFTDRISNAPNVIFTGWLSQEKLADYINAADIAILPIRMTSKGIYTRILEYMGCGKATITTKEGATGLWFAVKDGGLIVKDRISDIVDSAILLLKNEALRNEIGKNARVIAEKYFSHKSIGLLLESVYYKTIIARKKSLKLEH